MDLTVSKKRIAKNFSKYASSYDRYAEAQKIGALSLKNYLLNLQDTLPGGPILEIGCGTGLVSSEIVNIFKGRQIFLTDISAGMLDVCKNKIYSASPDISGVFWEILDGESLSSEGYALIVSSFTFQWFENLKKSIKKFRDSLLPGGWICCSFLGNGSFFEWENICRKLNIKYTGNPLPSPDDIKESLLHDSIHVNTFQEDVVLNYASPVDFFRALKKIGAGTNTNESALSPTELKQLIKGWRSENPEGINITYKINYALVEKKHIPEKNKK